MEEIGFQDHFLPLGQKTDLGAAAVAADRKCPDGPSNSPIQLDPPLNPFGSSS